MIDRSKKTERILNIWILLANNPSGFTIKQLADKFNVNPRTTYRDMLALGEDLHIPVTQEGKYWQINDSKMLPPVRFTIPEALNIFLSARLMLSYSHRYDPNTEITFAKLSRVLPSPLADQMRKAMAWMQRMPKDEKHISTLATVAEAWVSQKRLKIVYRPLVADKPMERVIEPYHIEPAAPGHASYVIGYCHLKKDVRTFKIERIESAKITTESYSIPSDYDANKYLGSSWGIIVGDELKTIKLKLLNKDMIRMMSESIWHPSQTIKKQKDGSTVMTLTVTDTPELLSWILGWGEQVEVMEPKETREAVKNVVNEMGKVYIKGRRE